MVKETRRFFPGGRHAVPLCAAGDRPQSIPGRPHKTARRSKRSGGRKLGICLRKVSQKLYDAAVEVLYRLRQHILVDVVFGVIVGVDAVLGLAVDSEKGHG